MILEAARFAEEKHRGVMRKFGGGPYIEHPMRVAGRVCLLPFATPYHVAAAWLHDTIEDCGVTETEISRRFCPDIGVIVHGLTNPSKQHEGLSRKDKKAMDREFIAKRSRIEKCIKLIDRIDNCRDSGDADREWKKMYSAESTLLVDRLYIPGDDILIALCNELRSVIKKMA